MLVEYKQTFKVFIESNETVPTNILTIKLKLPEELEFLTKSKLSDKKNRSLSFNLKMINISKYYTDLALWIDKHSRRFIVAMRHSKERDAMKTTKEAFINTLKKNYIRKMN